MSTAETWQTESTSSAHTEQIGERIGASLRGGEVIELVSDLGGGKTTFVRGLARGAGSQARVASPTFTVSREYAGPRFTIVHFDFYRLHEAGVVEAELVEYIGDPAYVVVVEWSDVVRAALPAERLAVHIAPVAAADGRTITCRYPRQLSYLFTTLQGDTSCLC